MTDGNTGVSIVCDFEVGIPGRTEQMPDISLQLAQRVSATVANDAAYIVLSQPGAGEMLGVACKEFRDLYARMMSVAIPGSRVQKCYDSRLEPVPFEAFSQ
jgi:hypothetical protein